MDFDFESYLHLATDPCSDSPTESCKDFAALFSEASLQASLDFISSAVIPSKKYWRIEGDLKVSFLDP